jgi:repressor LexA
MIFGAKLKSARLAKNLTQKQLAEKVGAKHNSISDWENDKSKPDVDTLQLLCGVLDIPISYFSDIERNATKDTADLLSEIFADPALVEYSKKLYDLSGEHRRTIFDIIDYLTSKEGR